MTSATIDESRSAPAASGVPSFGESSHAPEGIDQRQRPGLPERGHGTLVELAGPGHVEPR